MDKTKEELLKPFFMRGTAGISPHPSYDHIQGRREEIAGAMQTYADQEKRKKAIAFAEWIASQADEVKIVLIDNDWYWESDADGDQPLSEEYLYELFLKSLQSLTT